MKKITLFEDLHAGRIDHKTTEFNHTLYWAYIHSQEAGNEGIDFDDVIWDYDIDAIIVDCKKNNIDHFTISSTFSSLIATLAEFEKRGYKMEGLTEVYARFDDFCTGKKQVIPAIKMQLVK